MKAKGAGLILGLLLMLCLSACSKNEEPFKESVELEVTAGEQEAIIPEMEEPEEGKADAIEAESEPAWEYFEHDSVVDDFFKAYNSISSNPYTVDQISKGNVRTKAHAYNDTLGIEVIHVSNFGDPYIAISISTTYENEDTILYRAFLDVVQAVYKDYEEQEIERAWSELHSSGYRVSGYDFNGIRITYVPHIDTQEFSNPRLDMEFPIE